MPISDTAPLLGFTLNLPASGLSLQLTKVLGQGSFGTVYLAQYKNSLYAVKHIPSPATLTPMQKMYQQQEIAHHSKVSDHPKIISLYDAVTVKGDQGFFMVMEYCNQPDLFDFLADNRAERYRDPDAVLKELFAQVCDAIEHCHQRGIYHRDIKPENVMLTAEKDGTLGVRLGDFGLACDKRGVTRGCGSTTYMSPESHQENFLRVGYDPVKADVWSLGMLLCHMASGLAPWRKAVPSDPGFSYYLMYPKEGLDRLLQFDPQFMAVLKRVFALNPLHRPTVAELRDAVLMLPHFRKTSEPQLEVDLEVEEEEGVDSCPPTPKITPDTAPEVVLDVVPDVVPGTPNSLLANKKEEKRWTTWDSRMAIA